MTSLSRIGTTICGNVCWKSTLPVLSNLFYGSNVVTLKLWTVTKWYSWLTLVKRSTLPLKLKQRDLSLRQRKSGETQREKKEPRISWLLSTAQGKKKR